MDSGGLATVLPPRRPRSQSVLGQRWFAWVVSALAVVVAQVVMWNGWNRSGEWIPVTGPTALISYSVYGLACAVPVVLALFVLRHWTTLVVVLVALLAVAVSTGRFFAVSQSSTAAFAWFGPLVYGLPSIAVLWLAELCASWLMNRNGLRQRN